MATALWPFTRKWPKKRSPKTIPIAFALLRLFSLVFDCFRTFFFCLFSLVFCSFSHFLSGLFLTVFGRPFSHFFAPCCYLAAAIWIPLITSLSSFKVVVAALFQAAGPRKLTPQIIISSLTKGIWGVSSLSCLILIFRLPYLGNPYLRLLRLTRS